MGSGGQAELERQPGALRLELHELGGDVGDEVLAILVGVGLVEARLGVVDAGVEGVQVSAVH
jgi:hypothetical protein